MASVRTSALFSDSSLVSLYEFNSGALTTDSKGSNTLTNNNTVGEGAGRYGSASADFGTANTNKTFSRSDSLGIDIAGAHTIAFWYKFRTIPVSGLNCAVRLDSTTGSTRFNVIMFQSTGFYWDVSGSSVVGFTSTHDTSNWHHLALTVAAGGTCTIYLDGVSQGTQTRGTSVGSSTNRLTIGNDPGDTRYLNAYIDDLAFFTKELSLSEVRNLYVDTNPSIIFNLI